MKHLTRTWLAVSLAASAAMITFAVVPLAAQESAAAVLTQVRTALGGETALAAVKAISLDGPSRRMAGARELDSYVSLLLLVRPDKMRRSEETRFFNTNEITTTFDGNEVWQETVSRSGVGGGHSGPEHAGGGAGGHGEWENGQHDHGSADSANVDPVDASLTPDQLAAARARRSRMELQRWTIVFLADSTRPFTNAGQAAKK
jgi:hypothetical protein